MYKKIYLEVTNICNLSCPFCIKNNREKIYISIDDYKIILDKIKPYTKYLYLHVSGEPLMHPHINELINIGSKNFNINITTNGYLINKIKNNHNIRQINISLHSYNPINNISLNEYLNNICDVINNLHNDTYFSLRFWVNNKYTQEIVNYLNKIYNIDIILKNGFKLINNVFISINKEFIWPSLDNNYYNDVGTCHALKDHIGILSNGDIIPCCIDVNSVIKFGNIYKDNLKDIIISNRYKKMLNGFNNNKKIEELCKHCNFVE